jgi:hypothetical protein
MGIQIFNYMGFESKKTIAGIPEQLYSIGVQACITITPVTASLD